MDNWLIVSNCQTYGLANNLQAQLSDVTVEGLDVLLFSAQPEASISKVEAADKLFIPREIRETLLPLGLPEDKSWVDLPMFTFRAYHPDLTYLKHNDSLVDGPTNHYHSAIVYACFKAGLDQADTLKRFNGGFFERCGYLGLWQSERDRLVEEVNTTGVDIAASIRRWGREDAFMYSINHPKIRVLRDIASQLIKRQGRKPIPGISPHDNLASGPHFAVYPEIAESLGVKGEYVFKSVDSYRPFGLEQFVHQSFDVYAGLDPQGMMPHQHIDHVLAQL